MKVVIVNAYDRNNAGDAALLSVAINQISTAFPAADISYASLEDPAHVTSFESARNLGSIRRWAGDEQAPRSVRVRRKLIALLLLALPALTLRGAVRSRWLRRKLGEPLDEIREIAAADLVVGLGGGYLNGSPDPAGTMNVGFLVLPLLIAARLRVPVLLAPQSYGPFGNRWQSRVAARALNSAQLVTAREDVSLEVLSQIGVRPELIRRGVDSAFALPTETRVTSGKEIRKVGVTARRWLTGAAAERYEQSLAECIDWLQTERGLEVVMLPQVTSEYGGDDDRVMSRRIARRCRQRPTVIEDRMVWHELWEAYADLDVLIGTRFHSVIFALTSGVPAIAIAYEHKTTGIMRDLDLGQWVCDIESVDAATLRGRFLNLTASYVDYQRHLHDVLPGYQRSAAGFVDVLRDAVPRAGVDRVASRTITLPDQRAEVASR